MNYQVTRVDFFGQPNRRVWIKPEMDDSIERRIKDLQPVRDLKVRSIRCWPPPLDSHRTLFIYRFLKQSPTGTNLEDGSLMYVLGNSVQFDDAVRVDASGDLKKWAIEAMASGEPVRAVPCHVCSPGDPTGNPSPCPCGSPILSEWNHNSVINHNNCYSFARRARWCAGGSGSQPGHRDSNNEDEIRQGLMIDGLLPVTQTDVLGDESGDFVALLLEGAFNYHFLRLDGARWTHMPSGYAALACDADGHPIPRNGVPKAKMRELRFLDYYRVPPNTPLLHCS